MGFFDKLRRKMARVFRSWREVGEYRSTFSAFGNNAYKSEIVRSCIRPLADFTAKASATSTNKDIERLLNYRPNVYMNGHEFLLKVRTLYELKNNCFIYIERADNGKVTGFFPVPYTRLEALESGGELFIKFGFNDGSAPVVLPWADLAVLRKDYNESNFVGDDNAAIIQTLSLIDTTNQGISNAVRATANLRGIIKSTKSIMDPEDVRQQKEEFVRDYLSLENNGGIAALDATQEFIPINMNPVVTTWEQMREFRGNVMRYFGVSEAIMTAAATPEQIEAFYEIRIEPFLCDLSAELTSKAFTKREQAFNWIAYETNKLQFASLDKKISMYRNVVLYGGMLIDEWRAGCNMPPLPNGEGQKRIMRLDAAPADLEEQEKEEKDDE